MLRELQLELGLSLLFTTHNLAVVTSIADEVVVLQDGAIVERGPVEASAGGPDSPLHPRVTRGLTEAGRAQVTTNAERGEQWPRSEQ